MPPSPAKRRPGRPSSGLSHVLYARCHPSLAARLVSVLGDDEGAAELVRAAVELEVARRERALLPASAARATPAPDSERFALLELDAK